MRIGSAGKPNVVILGAGVCGLYAARTLVERGIKVTIIERDPMPGGLAAGHKFGENFYDMGVHMLHEHDEEIFEDMKMIMGDERIPVQLDAKIRWAGSFYRYPLQFMDMVQGIPPYTLASCVLGLFWSQAYYKIFPEEPEDAEEALIQLYGNPLYEFFFREFTERYWGMPTREIAAKFVTTKMPRLSAVDVLKKSLGRFGISAKQGKAVDSALRDETLHYSATGAETMPRKLSEFVVEKGGKLRLGCEVTAVDMRGSFVNSIKFRNAEGKDERIDCDYCLSTIPLPVLVDRVTPSVPPELVDAAGHLNFNAITIHGLLVKKQKCLDALYVYYRERFFHRIGEPKNAGMKVTPSDHTTLIVETTCVPGGPKWEVTDEVKAAIVRDLEAENICKADEIVEWNVMRSPNGYPLYRKGFEEHFDKIAAFIDGVDNLHTTGRNGGFCYPNMHGAMRLGADAADRVIERFFPSAASTVS
ncbi:MAG: FAD-dependent oxidoreductase [Verrucomicrobiae bacterium]|nr:FAD-dependent oxidoreductase [Verrucomicrobiae bacterium]